MASLRQFCTFSVNDLLLAIDVLEVQEVIRYQDMTRVPTAPPVVRGLINLRGQIVTAIDLRRRLGLPPAGDDQRPMNVVVRTDDGAVSLLVDEIGDVIELGDQKARTAARDRTARHPRAGDRDHHARGPPSPRCWIPLVS